MTDQLARRGVQGYRVWHVWRWQHLRGSPQDCLRARPLLGELSGSLANPHTDQQVSNDFGSYIEAQALVDELWGGDHSEWDKKSIRTAFAMGEFSSDRSVQDYADGIWSGEHLP
jgi:glucan phosphorylase